MPDESKKFKSVPFETLLWVASRNLLSKKLRSILTIVGIMIGIGAIFFLLSFGLGLRNLVTKEIIGNTSVKVIDVTSPNSKIIKIDQNNIKRMQGLAHSSQVGSSFSFPGIVKYDRSAVDGVVYGVDQEYMQLLDLNVVNGRLLQKDDAKTVVLNRSSLNNMGISDPQTVIDKEITLTIPLEGASTKQTTITDQFKVVGVIDSTAGSEIFVPNFVFQNAGVANYSQVKVVADDTDNVSSLRAQIESMGLQTTSTIDTVQQVNDIFRFFNLILVGFGAIGMIVAILGMFNTLTISLLERTREIGLMIALGARNRDVKLLFNLEALILSATGALLGIFFAMSTSFFINVAMNVYARQRGVATSFSVFATPLWLVVALVAFMLLVGLAVAWLPARRAERINPIDALRRE